MSVLVTGAAGFAGGHVLDLLSGQGAHVIAWHRPGGAPPVDRDGVRWQAVDVTDAAAVRKAIAAAAPTAVYHCAAESHVARSNQQTTSTYEINVRGTHYLVDALQRAGVHARLVVPSSAMVYASSGDALTEDQPLVPQGAYAVSKLAQEMTALRAREDGLKVTVARAFNHVGPRQDPFFAASGFARRIADIEAGKWEPEVAVGNLEARRDLTDVRDTIR